MAKRNREMSRTELLFHSDREAVERVLGTEFTDRLGWLLNFGEFHYGARQDYVDRTLPGLQALQLDQYPLTAAFTDPVALARIKLIHEMNAYGLISQCRRIMENMLKGMDVAANYPELEKWRAFYCHPQEPEVTIGQHAEEENAELRQLHEERKRMMDAYYDLMQPLLFRLLPTLDQLEGDHWVLYAVTIRDAYEEWKSLCEDMEMTIEYDMPQESIAWKHADWFALLNRKMQAELD